MAKIGMSRCVIACVALLFSLDVHAQQQVSNRLIGNWCDAKGTWSIQVQRAAILFGPDGEPATCKVRQLRKDGDWTVIAATCRVEEEPEFSATLRMAFDRLSLHLTTASPGLRP